MPSSHFTLLGDEPSGFFRFLKVGRDRPEVLPRLPKSQFPIRYPEPTLLVVVADIKLKMASRQRTADGCVALYREGHPKRPWLQFCRRPRLETPRPQGKEDPGGARTFFRQVLAPALPVLIETPPSWGRWGSG